MEEVYSIDEVSLATLPYVRPAVLSRLASCRAPVIADPGNSEPLYGMIFLYQYIEEESSVTARGTPQVWFANQVRALLASTPDRPSRLAGTSVCSCCMPVLTPTSDYG